MIGIVIDAIGVGLIAGPVAGMVILGRQIVDVIVTALLGSVGYVAFVGISALHIAGAARRLLAP